MHLLSGERIERSQRLIHQDHVGIVCEASGQGHALLHTARKFVDHLLAEAAETDDLEQFVNATLSLGLVRPVHLRAERNVLLDC